MRKKNIALHRYKMGFGLTLSVLVNVLGTSSSIFCDVAPDSGGDGYCVTQFDAQCLVFVFGSNTAKQAHLSCQKMCGTLATVQEERQTQLKNFLNLNRVNYSQLKRDFWIGLYWQSNFKMWYWDDGSPFTYHNFEGGRHDSYGDCVQLQDNFKWENIVCDHERAHICQIDLFGFIHRNQITGNISCEDIAANKFKDCEKSTQLPTTSSTTTVMTFETTESAQNGTENSTEVFEGSTMGIRGGGAGDGSSEDREDNFLVIVVGSLLVVSVIANAFFIIVLCRRCYTKRWKRLKDPKHISLVDILNVDKDEKNESASSGTYLKTEGPFAGEQNSGSISSSKAGRQMFKDNADSDYEEPIEDGNTRLKSNPVASLPTREPSNVYDDPDNPRQFGSDAEVPEVAADAVSYTEVAVKSNITQNPSTAAMVYSKLQDSSPGPLARKPISGNIYGIQSASDPISSTPLDTSSELCYDQDNNGTAGEKEHHESSTEVEPEEADNNIYQNTVSQGKNDKETIDNTYYNCFSN